MIEDTRCPRCGLAGDEAVGKRCIPTKSDDHLDACGWCGGRVDRKPDRSVRGRMHEQGCPVLRAHAPSAHPVDLTLR